MNIEDYFEGLKKLKEDLIKEEDGLRYLSNASLLLKAILYYAESLDREEPFEWDLMKSVYKLYKELYDERQTEYYIGKYQL